MNQQTRTNVPTDPSPPPRAPAIISVRGLTTRIGGTTIHHNLDLDVERGEIVGLVGGSGSGKSVLLRTLIGLMRPAGGTIRIADLPIDGDDATADRVRRIGVLFQHGALYSSLTVIENIALVLIEHAGLTRREASALASIKLGLAGLESAAGERYPAELSGGMIKRAALARALALDPQILFLDEPTAGLDPIAAAAFDRLLLTLRDALGLTVFLVTHDLDTLYTTCDRVAVLAERRIFAYDTPDAVAENPDAWIQAYFHGPRGRAARKAVAAGRTPAESGD